MQKKGLYLLYKPTINCIIGLRSTAFKLKSFYDQKPVVNSFCKLSLFQIKISVCLRSRKLSHQTTNFVLESAQSQAQAKLWSNLSVLPSPLLASCPVRRPIPPFVPIVH